MIHYMDGGPFESKFFARITVEACHPERGFMYKYPTTHKEACTVLAYNSEKQEFVGVLASGEAICGEQGLFDPPPPIPAAARKPQPGEVWLMQGSTAQEPVVRLILAAESAGYKALTPDAYPVWYDADWALRPATPAESEPFRPILEGLKRSLGES